MATTRFDVYISYRSHDRPALTRTIADFLRENNLRVWLYDWFVGDDERYNWLRIARETLEQCDNFIILIGPRGLGRGQEQELDLALSFPNIRIIPVLTSKASSDKLPNILRNRELVDLSQGFENPAAQTGLLDTIRKYPLFSIVPVRGRPAVADKPIDMPIDILLALPRYVTQSESNRPFDLWNALPRWLEEFDRNLMGDLVQTYCWSPGLNISNFGSFQWARRLGLVSANFNDPRRLPRFPRGGQQASRTLSERQPRQFELLHFQGQVIRNGLFFGGQEFMNAEQLRPVLDTASTRLLILNVPLTNVSSARGLAEQIANQNGPAVLVVADSNHQLRNTYFSSLYNNLFRNLPYIEIVTPPGEIDQRGLQVWSYCGDDAEELFLFSRKASQLRQEYRERVSTLREPFLNLLNTRMQFFNVEAPAFHRTQVELLREKFDTTLNKLVGNNEFLLSNLARTDREIVPDMWSELGERISPDVPRAAIEILFRKNLLSEMPSPKEALEALEEFRQGVENETISTPRVLNANFADPNDAAHTLPLNYSLGAGREYDLRLDVGPRWDKNLTLFQDNEQSAFPDQVIQERLLTPEDRERGAFDVLAVFVSEDFTPHLISARMSVPVLPTGRSIPYIGERLAEQAGWMSLRVFAPVWPDAENGTLRKAHGRLGLYYKNNLLQSGAIHVNISREAGLQTETLNSGEIDFVLTGGFQQIPELFDQPVSVSEGNEQGVRLNLTVNHDSGGNFRIVVVSEDGTDSQVTVPAAWMPYNLDDAKVVLEEARKTLLEIIGPLLNKPTKSRDEFTEDLQKLAVVGSKVRNKVILGGLSIEERESTGNGQDEPGMTPAVWTNLLFEKLDKAGVIQVARTGPASYVFPWALLYEYPMEGPEYRSCDVITDEWNEEGERHKPAGDSCPYRKEEWHEANVICPYGFWGIKHVIEQPAPGLHKEGDQWKVKASSKILTSNGIPITVIATEDVDAGSFENHINNLKKLKRVRLEPLEPIYEKDLVEKVLSSAQIVYFLCHGEWEPKELGLREKAIPYLSIGKHDDDIKHKIFPTTLTNLIQRRIFNAREWDKRRPLVIMNGCETANINPSAEANFVSAFDALGASGVIGTEVQMLMNEAYEMAEEILRFLIETKDGQMGRAIREMRWRFMNKGSLLGLAYTPYCRATLHIEAEP